MENRTEGETVSAHGAVDEHGEQSGGAPVKPGLIGVIVIPEHQAPEGRTGGLSRNTHLSWECPHFLTLLTHALVRKSSVTDAQS